MITVQPDWWKTCFDETYLLTDARTVCDPELTRCEVSFLEQLLQLNTHDRILDLCGGHGRHAIELSRRGYRDLTVLDYSQFLLAHGQANARQEGHPVTFLRSDARKAGLRGGRYTVVMLLANSFGYLPDEEGNLDILREIHRLLSDNGRLCLDLTNGDYVRAHGQPFSWHAANEDVIVMRLRDLGADLVRVREIVLSRTRGLLRDSTYGERLYKEETIRRILDDLGFDVHTVRTDLSPDLKRANVDLMSARMIVAATKR